MTVQELIDNLEAVTDKTLPVYIYLGGIGVDAGHGIEPMADVGIIEELKNAVEISAKEM